MNFGLIRRGSWLVLLVFLAFNVSATPITHLASSLKLPLPIKQIEALIKKNIAVERYRAVKFQVIYRKDGNPDHLLVFLFSKKCHHFSVNRIDLSAGFKAKNLTKAYRLQKEDYAQQPGAEGVASCPDDRTEFIAFAPNYDDFELTITKEVAKFAKMQGLYTVRLLLTEATSEAYLNYMACPKLKGNFYDGDASPYEIITYDGIISHQQIARQLKNHFRYKVTNIWLACQAFNDPMKSALIQTAEAQKYAAGVNNLLIGPSDRTAACAIKAAILGKPMKASFHLCYKKYDTPQDIWGFDGLGSDIFGT